MRRLYGRAVDAWLKIEPQKKITTISRMITPMSRANFDPGTLGLAHSCAGNARPAHSMPVEANMLARARTQPRRHNSGRADLSRRCEAHKQWIRGRECAFIDAGGCRGNIQAAHVRLGTDGGTGLKPSDVYCWPACEGHHHEQHQIGEPAFALRYGVDLVALATAYAKGSPHWTRLQAMLA